MESNGGLEKECSKSMDEKKECGITRIIPEQCPYAIRNEPEIPKDCPTDAGWIATFECFTLSNPFLSSIIYDEELDKFVPFQQLFSESISSPPPQATHLVKRIFHKFNYRIRFTEEYESVVKLNDGFKRQSWNSNPEMISIVYNSSAAHISCLIQNASLSGVNIIDEESLVSAILAKKIDGLEAIPVCVVATKQCGYHYGVLSQDQKSIELIGQALKKRPTTSCHNNIKSAR
jgi:hypothetical protein